jgi:hypothetical protein
MSKLTTDELVEWLSGRVSVIPMVSPVVTRQVAIDNAIMLTSIKAKLRAADELAEACGELVDALSYDTNEGEGLSSKQFDQRLHRAGCAILTYDEAES